MAITFTVPNLKSRLLAEKVRGGEESSSCEGREDEVSRICQGFVGRPPQSFTGGGSIGRQYGGETYCAVAGDEYI